jgi:transcriptional regulator with GAF, ATPase, and Fis domain
VLYRLALDMADAATPVELGELVVDALFRATPAEVCAVLSLKEGREFEPVVYRHRGPGHETYHKVSNFVSHEVSSSKQAVLAENVALERHLKDRDSIAELKVASLICAPVLFEDQLLGLVHLYRTSQHAPLNPDDLEFTLAVARQLGTVWHRLRKQATLSVEVKSLKQQLRIESDLVGESPALGKVESQIRLVGETKATVLIRGESGVGKELVARALHDSSPRREQPFVTLNCAALTETLLESELFGHEKGAFTGATERMIGKFEAADTGTIFLDEIGEMALSTQAKFLRVLEGHPFERVGGNTPIKVDVRVVAATNRQLEDAVRAATFRRDLFFRLQVVQIDVPPLRDRLDDVPLIAEHFLKRFVRETGRKIRGFSDSAIQKLTAYRWPGNVRELRNVVERAVALGSGPLLDAADIWLSEIDLFAPSAGGSRVLVYKPESLEEVEKRHIVETLRHTDWNKSQAAAILGIERSTLDRKIKGYGLAR